MQLSPEIENVIASSNVGDNVTRWRHDTVATVVRDLLTRDRQLRKITPEEVFELMNAVNLHEDEHPAGRLKICGLEMYVGGREIRIIRNSWYSSNDIPGLFARGEMPTQSEAHAEGADQINALLAEMGYPPQARAAHRIRGIFYVEAFETTEVTIVTPEAPGEYQLFANYTHRPPDIRLKQSQDIAKTIAIRIRNADEVMRLRREAEKSVAEFIAKVPGMKVVGSTYNIDSYHSKKHDTLKGHAYAQVEMIGDTLDVITAHASTRDEGKHLKSLIAKHKANQRALAKGKSRTSALMCEPILAAAIRDKAKEYGEELLMEIESLIGGKTRKETNVQKRKIGNLNIKRGLVHAPITLQPGTKGVHFKKERIAAGSIKQLPEMLVQTMPGRKMRDVIDHPWLEGLVIKSMTINSAGLQLRPEDAPVPLKQVISHLRRTLSKRKSSE